MTTQTEHNRMANAIRFLSADAVEKANSGHPGMPMGMADVATVLYTKFLKFDPKHPHWPDRDRFILSAGHGSMLLYSLLHLTGYEDFDLDQIKNFRQMGSRTAGHPEFGHGAGIETTTGPLGQGIATSVGFALGERIMNARFGNDVVDHFTYVIAGDGCLMEGISQEAISMAGHMKLSKLIVLFDDNGISIDGPTSLSTSEDHKKRFEAAGWDVQQIDGHDPVAIEAAIAKAKTTNTPSMIACKTVIGFGAPTKGGTSATHGSPLGATELAGAREKLGWTSEPFDIPADILGAWRNAGARGKADFDAWGARFENLEASLKDEFERRVEGKLPENWIDAFNDYKKQITAELPKVATRKSSQNVLEVLTKAIPEMIGGSADLTGSNNTKTGVQAPITADGGYHGGYIYYGIREHGMAAAMNGLALHGGVLPYGGTFLVFTDYCRPAIRLSALMNQRVVYVMTHDSIGLGEDGPT
ncbi:transketolase, partial [Thalassospira sp.]